MGLDIIGVKNIVIAQNKIELVSKERVIENYKEIKDLDEKVDPIMFIARSFDVNRPGITPDKLVGGVIGGSLKQGVIRVGDEIEIRPGRAKKEQNKIVYRDLDSEIVSLNTMGIDLKEAKPGGLIGIGTKQMRWQEV